MDLDILKGEWRKLSDGNIPRPDDKLLLDVLAKKNLQSAPQRVKRIYEVLLSVCLLWIPMSILTIRGAVFPVWVCVAMAVYFTIGAACCADIIRKVGALRFGTMTVVEALGAVCRLQRSRVVQKVILWPLCIPMMGAMLYYMGVADRFLLIGGVCGALIGLFVGLMLDIRIRRQIKAMKNALEDACA